jgi:hypothetical protein
MKLNSLVMTTIASGCGLLACVQIGAERPVSAEPRPCVTYEIEGEIKGTIASPESSSLERTPEAEVYVHFGDKPLVGHQVFATFAGANDQIVGEPVMLVTNELGRATVEVPQGAVNVAFMTESPAPENCTASTSLADEPVIVSATIPVQPSVDGAAGRDQGVTYADIYDTAPDMNQSGVDEVSNVPVSAPELARTGPISRWVLTLSVVVFGVGIGLGMGRGRQAARAER